MPSTPNTAALRPNSNAPTGSGWCDWSRLSARNTPKPEATKQRMPRVRVERGSVVGSAISPVIKICANPETYRKLSEDMDINAGKILEGESTPARVGDEIYRLVRDVAGGAPTVSEALGHQEFILTYKQFEPIGPACLPVSVGGERRV